MKLHTFMHDDTTGWSTDGFPAVDSANTLVIVFGASNLLDDGSVLAPLISAYPKSKIMGCSTSGEIFHNQINDNSLSVAVMQFEKTVLKEIIISVDDVENTQAAASSIATQLKADDLSSVFVLSDGLAVNGSQLANGLSTILGKNVSVSGGLAGDGDRFSRTWVLNNGKPVQNHISAIGFYGDAVQVGHGFEGGWDKFGLERTVTKSENNVLYELDGKPALELYKKYLGELASGLPATALLFPLAICADGQDDLVRTILAIDEDAGTMTFAGDIPQGCKIQMMSANSERLINGAADAAVGINVDDFDKSNSLAIAISCVGRRLVLKDRVEEETEATLDVMNGMPKQIGFYSYGELSPVVGGSCGLHNQSMTLTVFSETTNA